MQPDLPRDTSCGASSAASSLQLRATGPEGQSNGGALRAGRRAASTTDASSAPADGRTDEPQDGVRRPDARPPGDALPRWQPPRHAVRRAACPTCGAQPGEPCSGRRGPRVAHHAARVRVVDQVLNQI